ESDACADRRSVPVRHRSHARALVHVDPTARRHLETGAVEEDAQRRGTPEAAAAHVRSEQRKEVPVPVPGQTRRHAMGQRGARKSSV
ncbi:MAG: hypothetical protein GY847_30955, partial [Proteobacteria bacterium]|nr:hypothetical protein [Pseudomonadota bacterium]